ncbi:MAG: carboxymuconolactone decarboxylase family protein [Gemmatimonadota bacterium]
MTTAPLSTLDEPTSILVQLAAHIAGSAEPEVRGAFSAAVGRVPTEWVEELIVQSYLFCGFPRALNAAREWRRASSELAPITDEGDDLRRIAEWQTRGQVTCAAVYGSMYDKLRVNVRALHPALDAAMLVEGYGKILSRPGLDLPRRELCIVAACAVTGQERQLHSHLHGALNVGVSSAALAAALDALESILGTERTRSARLLLARVAAG